MKRFLTAFYILTFASIATMCAQESQTLYNFLRLPVSAHAAALGGDNTTPAIPPAMRLPSMYEK